MQLFRMTFRDKKLSVLAPTKLDAVRLFHAHLVSIDEITPRHDIRLLTRVRCAA